MQLYAMYRDGHAPAPGVLALLTDFFSFQMAAVTLAVLGCFLHWQQLISLERGVLLCFFVGTALNLVVVAILCIAVFSSRVLPALWKGIMVPARRAGFPSGYPLGISGGNSSGRICASAVNATAPIKSSWGKCS